MMRKLPPLVHNHQMQASCRPMHSSWTGTNARMTTNKPQMTSSASWPQPAGVSSLHVHKSSTSNGLIPAKTRPAHLPPIKGNSMVSPQGSSVQRGRGRGKPGANHRKPEKRSSQSSIKWAGIRTKITILQNDTNGDHNHRRKIVVRDSSDRNNSQASSCPSKFTVGGRNSALIVNDKDLDSFDRLRRVYLNQGNKKRRMEKLKKDIVSYQENTVEKEMEDAKRDFEKKVQRDQLNRMELRRVRDKHLRMKQSRLRNSYMTLAALETPEVSRLAFGLPEQGQEFTKPVDIKKAEKRIKSKWESAMKKVTVVDRLLHAAIKDQPTLPEIKIRRTSLSHRSDTTLRRDKKDPKLPDYFKQLHLGDAASVLQDVDTADSPEPDLDSDDDGTLDEYGEDEDE